MTAAFQPESTSPSRRALLAGALGGIGVWAATAIGRASPTRALDGGNLILGQENSATNQTSIINDSLSGDDAVFLGSSASAGIGVYGTSGSHIGVRGVSFGNSTGIVGSSGFALPAPRPKTGAYGYANQDIYATGVYGLSPLGVGLRGKTTSGYAGYFEGRVYTNAFYELGEVGTPAAPLSNRARLFVRDNGAGKTQLCVRFHTGAVQVIKTEP